MEKRNILLLIVLLFLFGNLPGQTLRQYQKAARQAFEQQDYYSTLYYLDIIQEIDSSNIEFQFKRAEAARHFNAYQLAEKQYQKVLEHQSAEQYPAAKFWLAAVQKMQGKYNEAIAGFNQYLQEYGNNPNDPLTEDAKKEIQACNWAKELIKINDKDLEITQLPEPVNTNYSDFAAIPYQDKILYSSLQFKDKNDKSTPPKLYNRVYSWNPETQDTALWNLGAGNQTHVAHVTFNKDKSRMYYNICRYKEGNMIRCEIYTKQKTGDTTWSKGVRLPDYINVADKTSTQPNIGYLEREKTEVLFFVSDRTGGKGGMDIWQARLNSDGHPLLPENLQAVNSEKDENAPFFHNYTQTLYFSSNGRKSLGGFDIYKSPLLDGNWSEPDHTGYPLNSSYNDIYFYLNRSGSEGYFSSNREGSRFLEKEVTACCNDIFKASFNSYLLDLRVLTFLNEDGEEIPYTDLDLKVYEVFEDAEKEVPLKESPIDHIHNYRINSNKDYRIVVNKEGFFPVNIEFNTNNAPPDEVIEKKVVLYPLQLDVFVFEDNMETPLDGATVVVTEIDEDGTERIITPMLTADNQFKYPLKVNKNYKISATKPDYEEVVATLTTFDVPVLGGKFVKNLVLEKSIPKILLQTLKPFPLYFDNDQPAPSDSDTTTDLSYPEAMQAYKSKKDYFITEYTKNMTGNYKRQSAQKIENFFTSEIDTNYYNFLKFTDAILERLEFDREVTISVQAYTSPLATEEYNLKLSKRRISSMLNFYRSYKNGAMKKYVDNGKLSIILVPHGESKAPKNISDSRKDRKNSVYSLEASRQRRVEIIDVNSLKNQDNINRKAVQISSGR